MGLFHKHLWQTISAKDMTHADYDLTDQEVIHLFILNERRPAPTERIYTAIVQQCADINCKRYRNTEVDGHHAKEILEAAKGKN